MDVVTQDRENLSLSPGLESGRPQVAIATAGAASAVHVVWEQDMPEAPGYREILHRFRPFDTASGTWLSTEWSPEAVVALFAQSPSLSIQGEIVIVAYEARPVFPEDPPTIMLARYDGAAFTWSDSMPVAIGGVDVTEEGSQPFVAIDPATPNTIWLTWIDNRDNRQTPYAARLDLSGEVQLSGEVSAREGSQSPAIGADQEAAGGVWATWSSHETIGGVPEGRVWRSRHERRPMALIWESPRQVNKGSRGSGPQLAVSPEGDVCVSWQELMNDGLGRPDILLDCMNHPKPYNFSDSPDIISSAPSLVYGSGVGALLAWREGSPTDAIDLRQGPPPSDMTAQIDEGAVRSPDLSFDGRVLHAVYVIGSAADAEVYYTRVEGVEALPTPTAMPPASTTPTATASVTPGGSTATASATRTPAVTTGTPGTATATTTSEASPTSGPATATPTPDGPRPVIFLPIGQRQQH